MVAAALTLVGAPLAVATLADPAATGTPGRGGSPRPAIRAEAAALVVDGSAVAARALSPAPTAGPSALPTATPSPTASVASPGPPASSAQLPGGGRVLFPGRRLVALYGHPGSSSLGVLGEQGLSAAIARARAVARPYRSLSDVPVVPAFELIATVAQRSAGKDGDYSGEASVQLLRPWVQEAGRQGMFVVLDLQPGRADLLEQARRYRSLLLQPHVGLAVDPEWKLRAGQQPLGQIGSIDAAELNRTSAWLASLCARPTCRRSCSSCTSSGSR